jgi:hypothetical protein
LLGLGQPGDGVTAAISISLVMVVAPQSSAPRKM